MSLPPSFSRSDQLRVRAQEMLDDLRGLRWRIGGALLLVLIAGVAFGLSEVGNHHSASANDDNYSYSSSTSSSHTSTTSSYTSTTVATSKSVVVYVIGAVKQPGLVTLSTSARISDAVQAAGGLADNADPMQINLAAKVTDGQRVYVVAKGESPPASVASDSSSDSSDSSAPVDINSASETELQNLPGVGPSTAKAIVTYRTQHGSFKSVDDLDKVGGIGPAKLAQIKPQATV